MKKKKGLFLVLLMGAFANTQINVGGNIGISELVMCLLGPIVLMQDFNQLRRDGFGTFLFLAILLNIGCIASSLYNHTPFSMMIRGFATTYSLPACVVCFHRVLRRDIGLYKYALVGLAISSVINVFVFNQGAEGATAAATGQAITSGTLFWIGRLFNWVMLPIQGWYLNTPLIYSIVAPIGLAGYSIVGTASGRSAALGVLAGIYFVVVAGKSSSKMQKISKNIFFVMIFAVVGVFSIKSGYMAMGKHGLLNEKQQNRFEEQTEGGTKTGALSLLMHGRVDFFCGTYAALLSPVWGYGPWPVDYDGLYLEFLSRYGGPEDYEMAYAERENFTRQGQYSLLPSHSQIIQFWQWFGFPGLLIMLYNIYLKWKYMTKYLHVLPQLYGWLAVGMVSSFWHLFFSPYGNRVGAALVWCVFLLVRAIAEGKVPYPIDMQIEARKHDR